MKHTAFFLFLLAGRLLYAQVDPVPYSTGAEKGADALAGLEAASNYQLEYIEQYKSISVREMERVGIPASITLAQGILESNAGQSELAKSANNHFGIKCAGGWNGRTYHKKDDERNGNGELVESCFRKYDRPEESFYDHSEFLRDPRKYNRYGFLFNLDSRDYKGWARGLQAAGYATSPTYADNLIGLIERYRLYEYDGSGPTPVVVTDPQPQTQPAPSADAPQTMTPLHRVGRINDVKVVLAKEGETAADIARLYNIKPENLVNYNDRGFSPNAKLKKDQRVFIQAKRRHWRGKSAQHYVRDNQTMFEISQQYGIRLLSLYTLNGMEPGQEAANGESIYLKRKRPESNPVKLRSGGNNNTPAPGSLTPDDDYLFEIGNDPANKPPTPPAPGTKPATTGVPFPADPEPVVTQPEPQPTKPTNPAPIPGAVYHQVVKGDTLYNISKRYNTTPAKIKQLNNLPDDTIKIGQNLRVQ